MKGSCIIPILQTKKPAVFIDHVYVPRLSTFTHHPSPCPHVSPAKASPTKVGNLDLPHEIWIFPVHLRVVKKSFGECGWCWCLVFNCCCSIFLGVSYVFSQNLLIPIWAPCGRFLLRIAMHLLAPSPRTWLGKFSLEGPGGPNKRPAKLHQKASKTSWCEPPPTSWVGDQKKLK